MIRERLCSFVKAIPELGMTIIGVIAFLLSLFPSFALWRGLGIAMLTPLEKVLLWLLSVLVVSAGLERFRSLKPIRNAVSLSPETPLAMKLEKIEETVAQGGRLACIGVHGFYPNRGELPSFSDFLKEAQTDVLICAISADTMVQVFSQDLRGLVARGCSLRFLLPRKRIVEDEKAMAHLAPMGYVLRTPGHLDDVMAFLTGLRRDAEERSDVWGKVTVRVLDFVPPMGFIMLDGDSKHGKIRVEQYVYKCEPPNRPAYEVVPTPAGDDLFSMLRDQLELCWKEARE